MILANARQRLTRTDAQLAVRLLAEHSGEELGRLERRLADDGIDAILDDARLPAALVHAPRGAQSSLTLFAYVLVRHALLRAGEHDRQLAEYVAALVMDFGVRDRSLRIADGDDEVYSALAQLLGDVDDRDARRSFLVRAHLGNYALWMSGLFPDYIEQRRWRRGGPDLDYYESLGSRGFALAAEHRLAEQQGLAPVYEAAAQRFPVLRVALNGLSDRLLFPHADSPERLMRQVKDALSR